MLKFLISAVLALTTLNAFALGGDYKGNGGNVIYCPHKAVPYEVFDLFEARVAHGLNIQFAAGSTYKEIVENMLLRIQRLNPSRSELYRSYLKSFEAERRLMPDAQLEVLPGEEGWAPLEPGCKRVQAIVQFKNLNLNGYRYFVDASVWDKLNEQNKAALALHEFIYREGLNDANAFENSLGVRYFNGVLHSDLMPKLSLQKYIQTLQKTGLQAADAQGFPISLHSGRHSADPSLHLIAFWNENTIASAPIPANFVLPTTNGKKANYRCRIKSGLEKDHVIGFYRNGLPQYINLQCLMAVRINLPTKRSSGTMLVDSMEFNETGRISKIMANPMDEKFPDALSLVSDSYSIQRYLGPDSGGLQLHFNWDGLPDVICMNQDTAGKKESWRLTNNTRETFANSLQNAIAIGDDNNAYPYDYSCR